MYRLVVAILLGCILYPSVLLAQSSASVDEKPEFVMILCSYSYETEWSTALAKEVRNCLEKQRPDVKVNITYAGIAARSSFLADRFAMQGAFANGRLNNKIFLPNVLVLIGDESWMLYRIMNHRGIWGEIPVVLCGVHAEVMSDYNQFFPDKQLSDTSLVPLQATLSSLKVAAVIEPDHSKQVVRLAQTLTPGLQSIYYLSDGSYMDAYQKKKLAHSCDQAKVSLHEIYVARSNVDSVEQVLVGLSGQKVIVTNGVVVSPNVRVPVLSLRDMVYHSNFPTGGFFAPIENFASKTTEAIINFLETDVPGHLRFVTASDTAFYMNDTALMNAGLRSAVRCLPNVVERNIPPLFLVRHIRIITVVLLVMIILVFFSIRIISSRRYRINLNVLFVRYKTLYDEYQVVYDNMPVGLMLFDINGCLLKRNAESDVFFDLFAHLKANAFHLFDDEFIDEEMQKVLFRKEVVSRLVYLQELCYRIQCCLIADEETGANHILMIVIDNTEIEQERKAKEQIFSVLNFAMNSSIIGVSEYNLIDKLGFATDAWYDILDIKRGTVDFSQAHRCLLPADRERIACYLESVRNGASHCFLGNVQMRTHTGEVHYVRYLIQPLEFIPDKNHVIVAEMIHSMDDQIARDHELETAMKKAQEADRFKNAFVANMKDEIRVPLREIISCARELVATDDLNRRSELNACIEAGNDQMLKLLSEIIEMSKVELTE